MRNSYINLIRDVIGKRFPSLGHYNVVGDVSENVGDTDILTGDALEDISDIAIDLEEVIWCFANTSENDALWQYENSFQSHWGRHLRDLQLYLQDLQQ